MPVFRLGEILVRKGYLSADVVQEALVKQSETPPESRLPLGQILLEAGTINEAQLMECLEIQRRLAQMPPPQQQAK